MKKFPAAVFAAMFILITSMFGATVASAQQVTTARFKPAWLDVKLGEIRGVLGRVADAEKCDTSKCAKLRAKAALNASDLQAWNELAAASNEFKATQRRARVALSRVNKLLEAQKVTRKDVDELIQDMDEVYPLVMADHENLGKLAQRVVSIFEEQQAQGQRLTVIEQERLPVIEKEVAEVKKVADKSAAVEASISLYTGKGIAWSETGLEIAGAVRGIASGWGVYSGLSFGMGEVVSNPHPTSVVVRGGITGKLGGPNSPVVLDAGGLLGVANAVSLSNGSNQVGGLGLSLKFQPSFLKSTFVGVRYEEVWGKNEGRTVYAMIGIDPFAVATAATTPN